MVATSGFLTGGPTCPQLWLVSYDDAVPKNFLHHPQMGKLPNLKIKYLGASRNTAHDGVAIVCTTKPKPITIGNKISTNLLDLRPILRCLVRHLVGCLLLAATLLSGLQNEGLPSLLSSLLSTGVEVPRQQNRYPRHSQCRRLSPSLELPPRNDAIILSLRCQVEVAQIEDGASYAIMSRVGTISV